MLRLKNTEFNYEYIMKKCSKCHKTKPLSEYYKNKSRLDGRGTFCKMCHGEYYKSEKGKEVNRRCDQSEKRKIAHSIRTRLYQIKYPNRLKARHAVGYEIRVGRLSRPNTKQCHCCPKQAQHYHHYKGYTKANWLDIKPICRQCHKRIHKQASPGSQFKHGCANAIGRAFYLKG